MQVENQGDNWNNNSQANTAGEGGFAVQKISDSIGAVADLLKNGEVPRLVFMLTVIGYFVLAFSKGVKGVETSDVLIYGKFLVGSLLLFLLLKVLFLVWRFSLKVFLLLTKNIAWIQKVINQKTLS